MLDHKPTAFAPRIVQEPLIQCTRYVMMKKKLNVGQKNKSSSLTSLDAFMVPRAERADWLPPPPPPPLLTESQLVRRDTPDLRKEVQSIAAPLADLTSLLCSSLE